MEKKLPEITILGTKFLISVVEDALIEKDNPDNKIYFHDMEDEGKYYWLRYDPLTKNADGITHQIIKDDFHPAIDPMSAYSHPDEDEYYGNDQLEIGDIAIIKVDQLVKLDPEGMAAHYNLPIETIKTMADFEIIIDQDLYHSRLKGRQRTIDIIGDTFFVDTRKGVLQLKDDFMHKGIRFSDMMEVGDEGLYQFFYRKKDHQLLQLNIDNLKAVPKGIYMIEMQNEIKLDAVGFALAGGWNTKEFARQYPPQKQLTAKVIPWAETRIHELIKSNLENIRLKKEQNKARKPRQKRRKGI